MEQSRTIEINEQQFTPRVECNYMHDYIAVTDKIASGEWDELGAYRALVLEDLFFITYFILRIPINKQFWVQACRDVQHGQKSDTLDLWFREGGKSSIITTAETIQRILANPEERISIFSYCKTAAVKLMRGIKSVFENSNLLKACFPDVLFDDPYSQAPRWSEENGIIVKRKGFYREATLEAHGLIEGMPTGSHFTGRVYDDIMVADFKDSPEIIEKVKYMFDMSAALGTDGGWCRIIGTPYHYEDVIAYVKGKKDEEGRPLYYLREKPGTVGGDYNGESVMMSKRRLAEFKSDEEIFSAQILLNPTPTKLRKFNPDFLLPVMPSDLPERLYRFMAVDPAGERKSDKRKGDCWGMLVFGIEPYMDDLGISKLFILDLIIDRFSETDALKTVVDMYCRNGHIRALGVEKVGLSSSEIHITNALKANGRTISVEDGTLQILSPAGREKVSRITNALVWALNNGKIFICSTVANNYRERLKEEMNRFPYWHEDGLDTLAYAYDMIKDYKFSKFYIPKPEKKDFWSIVSPQMAIQNDAWMMV